MSRSASLDKIKLGYSPLTDTIYLYRHGKDPTLALDKRKAEKDVFTVLIDHMMYDAPNGSKRSIHLDNKTYEITVTPAKTETITNIPPKKEKENTP